MLKNDEVYFSKGNHKLPEWMGIFNLPSVLSCPYATINCKKFCYAKKAEIFRPRVLPRRIANLELSKSDNFENLATNTLKKMPEQTIIRIHESGDFYSPEYYLKWLNIIKNFPLKTFFAYTRSFFDEMKMIPTNFKLYFSVDESTDVEIFNKYNSLIKENGGKFAITGKHILPIFCKFNDLLNKTFRVCHYVNNKKDRKERTCRNCNNCYGERNRDVIFYLH